MNKEVAEIFYKIADILELEGVQWKPRAYRKAAMSIENLQQDVREIYKKGGKEALEEIPGVGEGIAKKIIQYIETGKIKEYEKLKKKIPKGVEELMKIPGLGAKKALRLYKELGIKSIKELKKAAEKHKLRELESFKEKTEENILKGIELVKKVGKRTLLGYALPIARKIENELKNLKEVKEAISAGSLRRRKETIGDIDILVLTDKPKPVVEHFTSMKVVKRVLAKGQTKAAIITKDNLQIDVRIVKEESFGSALQYFTGNKEHNIKLRKIAIKKGYKLNEYGLFKKNKRIAGKTEEEVYKKLGLDYIEPELRTDRGEIELAQKKKLPKIIKYSEVKGDLHVHTNWSDGNNSIEEMADYARSLGYKYLGICDHGGKLKIAHALNEKRLEKQIKEIEKINRKFDDFVILKGIEVDILADGSLSLKNEVLKKLDIVTASIHSGFKMTKEKMTARILKAMDNEHVKIIGHPTGRIIQKREPYALDLEKIFDKAKERKIALEINAFPDRLDLNDLNIREAIKRKVKLVINTDSHFSKHLEFMELGIAQARRGWASKNDILNSLNLKELKRWLEK